MQFARALQALRRKLQTYRTHSLNWLKMETVQIELLVSYREIEAPIAVPQSHYTLPSWNIGRCLLFELTW